MTPHITHLVVGPERHGVVRFGVRLNAELLAVGRSMALHRFIEGGGEGGVHVQFTDRLFGRTPIAAARTMEHLAHEVRRRGGRLTVTLHDVPQPSDGTWYADRATCYSDVCATADGVVVCSEHERLLLIESSIAATNSSVIPLPVAAPATRLTWDEGEASVGVFGYLYPGKGHIEVLEAMTGLGPQIAMVAIGAPSAGHEDIVEQLSARGRRSSRRVTVTGHVADSDVTARLQAVSVPVAHHRHVSASGSLNAWLSAGRRPLAPRTRYTEELAQRNPGCLNLYRDDPSALRQAIADALARPDSTWLTPGSSCQPTGRAAALRYAEVLEHWHR